MSMSSMFKLLMTKKNHQKEQQQQMEKHVTFPERRLTEAEREKHIEKDPAKLKSILKTSEFYRKQQLQEEKARERSFLQHLDEKQDRIRLRRFQQDELYRDVAFFKVDCEKAKVKMSKRMLKRGGSTLRFGKAVDPTSYDDGIDLPDHLDEAANSREKLKDFANNISHQIYEEAVVSNMPKELRQFYLFFMGYIEK